MRLQGKIALVTGAGSGIGRSIAEAFAAEGATIVVADVAEKAGRAVAETIARHAGTAMFAPVDVTDQRQVSHAIDATVEQLGSLDILVNNAGVLDPRDASVTGVTDDVWDRTFAINVRGVLHCCRAGIPAMLATGGGSVINIASFVALMGAATSQIAYTASKGAVLAMSREMGVEFARTGVRVNAICPGPIETPLLGGFLPEDEQARRLEHIPVGRFGLPDDVARAAVFLASDDSSYMTAAALVVDGGITAAYTTPR